MRTHSLLWRHPRALAALTALVLVARLVAMSAAPASAATPALTQVNPTQGVTLAGTAFTDQLQVAGANGTVTFAQTSGSAVAVAASGQVSALGSLSVGTYSSSGTDSDTGGDTGTWAYTLNVLAPAPSGFAATVVNVYQSEYAVAQQVGQGSSVQSVSQYTQTVNQLSATQMAALYNAVQQNPEWLQIPSLMQTVASDVPSTSSSPTNGALQLLHPAQAAIGATKGAKVARAKPGAVGLFPARSALGAATYNTPEGTPVQRFTPATCTSTVPDAAVFALQIVIDVSQGLYNSLAALAIGIADALDIQLEVGIAAVVASGVLMVAQIIHDVLAFEQQLYNECQANNLANEVDNIDNTTVQTYGLLAGLSTTVTQIQTTDTTTLSTVQAIQNQLTQLQSTLVQTITNDTQTLQTTIGSDTQAVTTQIQTDINGLHQDLVTVENNEQTLSQTVISQVNTDSSAVQTSLSSDLTKILNETDSDASTLTSVVTTGNQQVINLIQGNFSTQQTEYNQNLTFMIERALGQWGADAPPVLLMTPASQGGLLDSTPVGVQEVVTNDINTVVGLGGKVTPAAINELKTANAALAAKQYAAAYADYASCYEAFA